MKNKRLELLKKEDQILREFLISCGTSSLDYEDPTFLGWDKNLKPFSAKDLNPHLDDSLTEE
jgi:hypothetical protein